MSRPHATLPSRRLAAGWLFGCIALLATLGGAQPAPLVQVSAAEGEQGLAAKLAALPAGGGVVELGPGTFTLTRPIVLDRDDVELRGQGAGTRLVLAARANCPMVLVGSVQTPPARLVRRIVVRDLVIDGNREEQQFECFGGPCDERNQTALRNNGITIRGAEDILVERVSIRRARSGGVVLEKFCRKVRLAHLEAYDNEFDGVAAYETEDSEFSDLNLHHNRSAGFSFDWRFNRNRITDCRAEDNGSQGIFMRDAIANVFERLVLRNNAEQGVFMGETRTLPGTACRYNTFRAVVITGNRTQGIRINDASCNPNTLEDSWVTGNRSEDLSLADFGQLLVVRPRQSEPEAALAGSKPVL